MTKKNSSEITLTLPNPFEAFEQTLSSIKDTLVELFEEVFSSERKERLKMNKYFSKVSLPNFKFNFNKKTGLQIIIPVVVVLVLGIVTFAVLKKGGSTQVAGVATNIGQVKTVKVNREFNFPLTDEKGKKVGEFTYVIESAELRKQIIVKGQSATAIPGRTFLVLNLKLINNLKQGVTINTRDYVRFKINGNTTELFAADIHNDPVEAQAISTKNTRVGLAIDEVTSKIEILVGEIDGKKTTIPLEFN